MKFSFNTVVDPVNKLLIYEVCGVASDIVEVEHMLKSMVKMAGKNQVKNVVVDATQCEIRCTNVEIAKLMITVQDNGWLEGLKIARIVKSELKVQNIIEGLAEKLSISIKNFETRSEGMLWLLFDKEQEEKKEC